MSPATKNNPTDCFCRSPFKPAINCTLCYYIPMSKKYEIAMAAYYEKRDAINECTNVLNGRIPHSKLHRASTAAYF